MSAAQDSTTTANAPSTPSAANAPVDKIDKMDQVETPLDGNTLPPVVTTSTSPSSSPIAPPSAAAAPSTMTAVPPATVVSVVTPSVSVKKPSVLPRSASSSPKPAAMPQSPGRSAVTKTKSGSSRPTKHRCRTCRHVANPLMGTCPDCNLVFCNSHRMPEDHKCEQAENRRMELKREHRETLMRNATRQNKIVQI